MRARLIALAVVPLLLVTACGGKDEKTGETGSESGSLAGVKVTGDFGSEPTVEVANLSIDKQASEVLIKGDGPAASKDRAALINLGVFSGVDGKKIFSTWDSKQPLTVGGATGSQVLTGLDDALADAPRGSRVGLETPAADAVGEANLAQLGLKKGDALVVVADIISVEKADALEGPDGTPQDPPAGSPQVVESGGNVTGFDWAGVGAKPAKLQVVPLVQGDGPAIRAGRLVTFDYFGEVFKGKKPFDESYSKQPLTFAVGQGSLIKAWDQGLIGVKEGSRVMIIAPPDVAYGPKGNPPSIPANATLVFVLDVLGVDG